MAEPDPARPGLRVVLTVDVGPAGAVLGRGHDAAGGEWEPTARGLDAVRDVLRSIEDATGRSVPATWLPRADALIERQLGDRLAIFRRYATFLGNVLDDGHEVGWMPQVYEAGAAAVDVDDLVETHRRLAAELDAPHSVRMGDCYHDNRTMRTLDALGVRLDSSAVPGRRKTDRGWRMDWSVTPQAAYHPSCADYRLPGSPALAILEVPLTVAPIRAPYDTAPLRRYIDLCMHPELLNEVLREVGVSGEQLIAILHPDGAVAVAPGRGHPLIAHDREALRSNLSTLVAAARDAGREVAFRRLDHTAGAAP